MLAPEAKGVTADEPGRYGRRESTRPSLQGGQGGKVRGAPVRVCCSSSSRMHACLHGADGVAAHLLEPVLLWVA